MSKVLVIAEPGSTGEGNLDTMLRLLETAAECGANVWKPQWTSNPERMCERRRAPEYLDSYRLLAYPVQWLETFAKRCEGLGMALACTVYLPGDVKMVAPFTRYLKLASFENTDESMLEALADHRTPKNEVIVSTGMLEESEIPMLLPYADILLACTSAYPAPVDSMHLATIRTMRSHWATRCRIGLSDHSRNVLTGAVAVGAGASVIETHHRLSDTPPSNRDYEVAFNPFDFSVYVGYIRLAERLMGRPTKRAQEAEIPMMRYRSVP